MEEDLKILENYIKGKDTMKETLVKAIENLIARNKELENISMENLIEELTKVNPSNLSEEGLKLFNKINEIIDRNEELEKENIKIKTLMRNPCDIPKQIIVEKMKADIKTNEHTILRGRRNGKTLEYGIRLGRIQMCEELLQ